MRSHVIWSTLVMLAIGCGDDDAATGSPTSESSSGTTEMASASNDEEGPTSPTTSSGLTTSDVTTTTADPTDSESGTDTSTSASDSTTDATTTETTTTTDDESSSSGNASGDFEVRAFAVPGGLDRIWITAADDDAGICVAGILVWPMDGGSVELPDQWAWQAGWVTDTPADCDQVGSPADAVEAIAATGSVLWEGSPLPFPCEIDVDLELDFAAGAAWVPDSAMIAAAGVAVEGC